MVAQRNKKYQDGCDFLAKRSLKYPHRVTVPITPATSPVVVEKTYSQCASAVTYPGYRTYIFRIEAEADEFSAANGGHRIR